MTEAQPAGQSKIDMTEAPPTSVWGIVRRLGPGLIVAGSIVGSGELIATTKTGAEAGFWLLWLIMIGCVIKVFVQVEFGRYAISSSRTTMRAMNEVPGPQIAVSLTNRPEATTLRANWLVWYWVLMFLASLAQLGGIVGGVGQALAISVPLTDEGREYNEVVDERTSLQIELHELRNETGSGELSAAVSSRMQLLESDIQELTNRAEVLAPSAHDDKRWAAIVAFFTAAILVVGRYRLIQWFSTIMVALFTAITILTLVLLQQNSAYAIQGSDIVEGLRFRLPPPRPGLELTPLATALATFGIIGVGASELVTYPYWCLEKGYARFTGPRQDSESWLRRARGWMRVMRWDAFGSLVVYTFATIAFYLLGATTLGRLGMNPGGTEMIRTLAAMYEPVFRAGTPLIFLFGAFAVLYSTFFVANASHARVFPDALRVFQGRERDEVSYRRRVRFFSGLFPFLCLSVYIVFPQPTRLVLLSGVMQALMLPMLSAAALFFRYRRCDPRLRPGKVWDLMLWLSAFGMLVAGGWLALTKVFPALAAG